MQRLVKSIVLQEGLRSRLVFSDAAKVRLNPETHAIELSPVSYDRATGAAKYSTATDLWVRLPLVIPEAMRTWAGVSVAPRPAVLPAGTSVGFRLWDGTQNWWWSGLAWAAPTAGQWNTEADLCTHIPTFAKRTLALVVNLRTTDEFATPRVTEADVLMDCDIDYVRSIIADSLVPSLRAGFSGTRVDFVLTASGGKKVALAGTETPFRIVSVHGIYDHKADPYHRTNLFASFDAASQIATLGSAVAQGAKLWVELGVEPTIYVNYASQDAQEVEQVPAVIVDSFTLSGAEVWGAACAVLPQANAASVRKYPFRLAIECDVVLLAEKSRTLMSMMDKALEHHALTPLLHWRACDAQLSLKMARQGAFAPRPALDDTHQTRYTLLIEDVFLWLRPEEVIPLVQRFNATLHSDIENGGQQVVGVY